MECIRRIDREGKALAPRREAAEAFQASLREAMKGTIWVSGCNSWYIDEEGTPTLWPWSAGEFHKTMRAPDFADFELIDAA